MLLYPSTKFVNNSLFILPLLSRQNVKNILATSLNIKDTLAISKSTKALKPFLLNNILSYDKSP